MIFVDKPFGDAVIAGNGLHPLQKGRTEPWIAVLEVVSVDGHVAAALVDTGQAIPDDNAEVPDIDGQLEFVASHRVLWRAS